MKLFITGQRSAITKDINPCSIASSFGLTTRLSISFAFAWAVGGARPIGSDPSPALDCGDEEWLSLSLVADESILTEYGPGVQGNETASGMHRPPECTLPRKLLSLGNSRSFIQA